MNETDILARVLTRIKPGANEHKKMREVVDHIIALIDQVVLKHGLSGVEAVLVGSAARGTWISGEHDLDIFISFPEDADKEELKTKGLEIAKEVASEADGFIERYADHPYIHADFNGFKVDLVPCFGVSSASNIRSAVDRTPFHNQFVLLKIKGLEDDVMLLKQFMKAVGVYGSDLRTGGFSGYLSELLVIHYGSFNEVIRAADMWKPGITIDIINHGTREHNDVLVVTDPTDPARNVAAALVMDKFASFINTARQYLDKPSIEMFHSLPAGCLDNDEFSLILNKRGTSIVVVLFDKPDVVDDILYPQLFMFHNSLMDMVKRNEFSVHAGDVWAGESKAAIILEFQVSELPSVKKHTGPPVWAKQHAEQFKDKYQQQDIQGSVLSKVYIEDGRYRVDILRKYLSASDLIRHDIHTCRLGRHVGESIRSGFTVLQDMQVLDIKDYSFRVFLNGFYNMP
ncbi:MAG: CCA tRNA nucleotidyltransferase [Methanosarcinales archaeon]|nr:CCA tRNA nucleotidyltransferase [Methanosarcinales archaeon]